MNGYYVFLVFFYMTVWSVMLGTMISMFDFIKGLPWPESFLGSKTIRDLVLHIVSTLLCYVLCCIRNTKQLFFVSWFGIFTLILAYVVVVMSLLSYVSSLPASVSPTTPSTSIRSCSGVAAPRSSSRIWAWLPTLLATTSASSLTTLLSLRSLTRRSKCRDRSSRRRSA